MANVLVAKWAAANPQTGQTQQRIAPESSFIQEAEYDANTLQLSLTFKSGSQHTYFFVYPAVWQQFLESKSKGQFYSASIRGKHLSAKIQNKNISSQDKARKEIKHNG